MPSALAFVGGGLLTGIGRGLAETGKAKREAALAELEMKGAAKFKRVLADLEHKRALELEGVKQEDRIGLLTKQNANALELRLAPSAPATPSGYRSTESGLEFISGGPADPAQAGRLAEAGRAPGAPTPAQRANNVEIQTARARILEMQRDLQPGETLRDAILRRTQKATNTGRENPDYDPFVERDFRIATQRRVGNDPDYEDFLSLLDATRPAPQAATPEPVAEEGPGFFGRFFGGGAAEQPAAMQPGADVPVNPDGPFPQRRTTLRPTAPVQSQAAPTAPQTMIPSRRTTAFPEGVSPESQSALPASLKARLDRGDVLTEAELERIYREQPEVWRALRAYLGER